MRAVEHPSVIVDDAKEALAEKKHALDETAATIAAEFTSPADKKRLPVVLRVFGVLLIIGSGVALPVIAKTMYQAVTMFDAGAMRGEGISTIVVTFVNLAVLVALAVTLIVFGVRLIRQPAALGSAALLRAVRASSGRGSVLHHAGRHWLRAYSLRRRFRGHGGAAKLP